MTDKNAQLETWEESQTGYPEPTVITVDENTDFSKIHKMALPVDSPKIRRSLVGMMIFKTPEEFENWQREEPREIFEVTPKAIQNDINTLEDLIEQAQNENMIVYRIFVTYNAGIIE